MSYARSFWGAQGVALNSPRMTAPVRIRKVTALAPPSAPSPAPQVLSVGRLFFTRQTNWEELELLRVRLHNRVRVPTGVLVTGGERASRCHMEGTPS